MTPRSSHRSASPAPAPAARGLSATTAVVLLTVVTLAAAIGTAVTGNAAGRVFSAAFAVVTVYVALRIRVHERFTALVAPPLVYVLGLLAAALLDSESTTPSLRRDIEDTVVNLALNAPWLVGSMVIAAVVLLIRSRAAR